MSLVVLYPFPLWRSNPVERTEGKGETSGQRQRRERPRGYSVDSCERIDLLAEVLLSPVVIAKWSSPRLPALYRPTQVDAGGNDEAIPKQSLE